MVNCLKQKSKNLTITLLFFIFFLKAISASPLQIEYYGVVSTSSDVNMMKMAQDFFYTQLTSIDGLSVSDKRSDISSVSATIPDTSNASLNKFSFYAQITEDKKGENSIFWNCAFVLIKTETGVIFQKNKTYETYYKMLTNAKETIEDFLTPFILKNENSSKEDSVQIAQKNSSINIEDLSGSWTGEPYTDKILILRGGRGFIILKNGATMNISVSIIQDSSGENLIKIKQSGKANASFFPELSRELALKEAPSAPPVEWTFVKTADDTLSGTKKTLVESGTDSSSVQLKELKTTWHKK